MPTIITPEYLARTGSEHAEQMALFCWANMACRRGFAAAYDPLSYGSYGQTVEDRMNMDFTAHSVTVLRWLYAIPNGGGRSPREGLALKAEGVKPGVSDVCLPVMRNGYAGLYIEMKRRNGVPSDVKREQKEFLEFVTAQGYFAKPAFGWIQAADIIRWYLTE